MAVVDLPKLLATRVVVCDGAMGTMLHASGISLDRSLPELNLARPDAVTAIHQAYIAAGVDIIQTNTFGANRYALARYGLEDRVRDVNLAGVRVAQEAHEEGHGEILIAGAVGPVSSPTLRTRLNIDEIRHALEEQIQALIDGGVDLLLFETFGDLREISEAVRVAHTLGSLPIVAQMAFADDGRTLAGDTVEDVGKALEQLSVTVIGANCAQGPQGLLEVMQQLARWTVLPLSAQPNAGLPALASDGHFQYSAGGAYLARYARRFVDAGAGLVGGCCGTTPAHMAEVVQAVRGAPAPARAARASASYAAPPAGSSETQSQLANKLQSGRFVLACEVKPAAGRDAEQAMRMAARLKDAGADAILVSSDSYVRAHLSSVSLAVLIQQHAGIEAMLSTTAWDKGAAALQADLLGAYALGVRNVVCRTGRPPVPGTYPGLAGIWDLDAVGLIKLLSGLNAGRDYNDIPIGNPTSFYIGTRMNPTADDRDAEIQEVKRRLAAGASFLVTGPVFDVNALQTMLRDLGPIALPTIATIVPLHDFSHAEYLQHEVPGIALPPAILERMAQAGTHEGEVGQDIARDLILAVRTYVNGIIIESASGSEVETVALLQALPG